VAASSGLDILSHAIESFTAIPYTSRPRPEHPALRPAYQGSNPISDIWALQALRMVTCYLVRAVEDPSDAGARAQMILAASYAGIGFGNAGVHLPHGMSYPVSGMVRDYRAPGYAVDEPLIPHGISVVLNAPAAFRFTASSNPARHLEAAAALGVDVAGAAPDDAGTILANAFISLMRETGLPSGIAALGYGEADVPDLAEGAFAQQRPLVMAPRSVSRLDLEGMYRDAMRYW
jgi:hydroxyacid-oxoacid transhydrogenase